MSIIEWTSYSIECNDCYFMIDGTDEQSRDDVIAQARALGWTVDEATGEASCNGNGDCPIPDPAP